MPLLGILYLLVAVGFAVHAMRTGRPYYWLLIILFLPFVGSIAYVLFELVPELGRTRRAREVAGGVRDLVDPDRHWRRKREDAERTGSVDAKRALAEECERKGMWRDAITLYEGAAQGIFADDPALLAGLARAQLGADDAPAAERTLDRLRAAHPNFQSQDVHLVYARALEAQNRLTEAEDEYEALSRYYAGFEARTRYGLLLLRRGRPAEARALFGEVIKAASARGIVLSAADKDWLKVAKANL